MQIGRSFALLCMILLGTIAYAQEKKTVTGIVQDSKGTALANAAVKEKGTNNTVLSNERGAFTILIKPNAVLEVSYVGLATMEISTGASDRYTISLQEKKVPYRKWWSLR